MSETKRSASPLLSADKALGVVGGGLAAASLGFGVYMNVHGPVASFGHSQDFTVFAQLANPHAPKSAEGRVTTGPRDNDPLDMTSTASIPGPAGSSGVPRDDAGPDAAAAVISSVTLKAASADAATIVVDGHTRTVHIGDTVPTAGEVLEIRTGPQPTVKTSRGLILSSRGP